MATWTDVSSTVLEPGDPIRSVDIIAIKENIIALSEGASGAPQIVTAAIADSNVTTEKLETDERMNTTNVLASTAGASAGAVGTYAFLRHITDADYNFGATLAGSNLRPAGVTTTSWASYTNSPLSTVSFAAVQTNIAQSGTWRCMGVGSNGQITIGGESFASSAVSLWLRIS